MAARVEPGNVRSMHQSMHHFVAEAPWEDARVIQVAREYVLPKLLRPGDDRGWIVDDTGIPKKGKHSVGVARQYCGQLGKQENCQVAVSLSVANARGSLPIAYQLYLPQEWAEDKARRETARVPDEVTFLTKPQIALQQIRAAVEAGVPQGTVLADAAYGNSGPFRDGVTALGLLYCVGLQSTTSVSPVERRFARSMRDGARARGDVRLGTVPDRASVSVKALALSLPVSRFRTIYWREGTKGRLRSRFARVRVSTGGGEAPAMAPRSVEWLLIEWPAGEAEPTKYWLSTLPRETSLRKLVRTAKLRWRIERDYLELKDEIGLGHYEGRGWRGFHHHASLCIVAYAFLMGERLFSPSGQTRTRPSLHAPPLPAGFRPRGSPDPA